MGEMDPERISMGIVVNFNAGTVQGFSDPGASPKGSDFPLRIAGMNEATISFSGANPNYYGVYWSIRGTIDRVTGDVEATSQQTQLQTTKIISLLVYSLKCRPMQRQF